MKKNERDERDDMKVVCPRCNYFDVPHATVQDCVKCVQELYEYLRFDEERRHNDEIARLARELEEKTSALLAGKTLDNGTYRKVMI